MVKTFFVAMRKHVYKCGNFVVHPFADLPHVGLRITWASLSASCKMESWERNIPSGVFFWLFGRLISGFSPSLGNVIPQRLRRLCCLSSYPSVVLCLQVSGPQSFL